MVIELSGVQFGLKRCFTYYDLFKKYCFLVHISSPMIYSASYAILWQKDMCNI